MSDNSINPQAGINLEVITTLDGLADLDNGWEKLRQACAPGNAFLTWEWCRTWLTHYLAPGSLYLLIARDKNGAPSGIAPLVMSPGGGCCRAVRFIGAGEACPVYLDFIVAERDRRAFTHAVYDHLFGPAQALWDVLELGPLPAESTSLDFLLERTGQAGKVAHVTDPVACPVIDLPKTAAAFHKGLSANLRQDLKRKHRKLEEEGAVRFRHLDTTGTDGADFATCIDLHQARWAGRGGEAGAFASRRFRAFHLQLADRFAGKGWLNLDLLSVNGAPVAGIYGFTVDGVYHFYLPGFDPAQSPHASPGLLLLIRRIEQSIEAGVTTVDLLTGLTGYKLRLASRVRRCVTLRAYNRSLRGAAFQLFQGAKDAVRIVLR